MDLASETRREVVDGTERETSAQGMLAVHHLRKSYKARRVVEDVSMTVRRGEVVGLLGPNGAGKTTLFYMITGLIRPDAGLIELDGHDVTRLPMYRRARLERRRCEIARALAGRPSFMLLDEPFAGIDPIAVGDIQRLVQHLKRRGIGVLVTDHNVRETLGLIDRAYIVHAGRVLIEGIPAKIVEDPNVRRFYLGEEFRL